MRHRLYILLIATGTLLTTGVGALLCVPVAAQEYSLRFFGHGGSPGDDFVFPDRVLVPIEPHTTADIGATDFTIEFWMRATTAENPNGPQPCGFGIDWVNGNIIIDRDRFGQGRKYGISLLGGRIAFGVSSDFVSYTLCGATNVLDDAWHHIAVQREFAGGQMTIFVDGNLDASGPVSGGPAGDVSYPDGELASTFCSPNGGSGSFPCPSDSVLAFGAEKHGFQAINYSGRLDEVRLSSTIRYATAFVPSTVPLLADNDTAALYHFNEGSGLDVNDASGVSNGVIQFGGAGMPGPEWSTDSPFAPVVGIGPTPSVTTGFNRPRPNPFGESTRLELRLETPGRVRLALFDVRGRRVRTLLDRDLSAGPHVEFWDGRNDNGNPAPQGVYFMQMNVEGFTQTRRVVLIR